jgi:hypothetical protein
MNQAEFKEVAWLLLLIPFGIVSAAGIFFIFWAWWRACQTKTDDHRTDFSLPTSDSQRFSSGLFELPNRWLAIKTNNPAEVQAALNLDHPIPCSLEEGLLEAREDKLFISPSLSGWVLVVGSGLPGPFEDVDECFHFLLELSRKLGQIQFFNASRAVGQHAWVLMERGRVYRAYAWSGETIWNQGPITAAEKELNLACFDYCVEQNGFSIKDKVSANTERIGQLAARWGIDPAALNADSWTGEGIVGGLSQSSF